MSIIPETLLSEVDLLQGGSLMSGLISESGKGEVYTALNSAGEVSWCEMSHLHVPLSPTPVCMAVTHSVSTSPEGTLHW